MKPRPLLVALEGPCCAGKTTLATGLLRELRTCSSVACVKDYSDYLGTSRDMPRTMPVPRSVIEERRILERFLTIEAERTEAARALGDRLAVVLIDRSVHTLFAHCHALSELTGLDYSGAAHQILDVSRIPLWPHVVLYLDVSQESVRERNRGRFAADSIYIDPDFNRDIRFHFERLSARGHWSRPSVVWLNASVDSPLLRQQAMTQVKESFGANTGEEEAL